MASDLLTWLAAEDGFYDADFWKGASWHREPPHANWGFEAGMKCTIAGNLGEGSMSTTVNGIEVDKPIVFTRNSAFVRAFLKKNCAAFGHTFTQFARPSAAP